MFSRPTPHGLRVGVYLAPALCLSLTGCFFLPEVVEDAGPDCSHETTGPSAEQVDGERVVMVDRSASLWRVDDGVLDPGEHLVDLLADEAFYTSDGERLVTLGLFDGTSSRADFTTWELPPSDLMDEVVESDQEEFRACLQDEYLPPELTSGALSEGSDVMSAFTDGEGRFLSDASGELRELVVVTDGRSNSGCFDLTELAEEWSAATEVAERAVQTCQSTGEWPTSDLAGLDVAVRLLATTREGDSRQGHAWLSDLWREVCEASEAESCTVPPHEGVDGGNLFPEADAPSAFPEDPTVMVPAWREPCQVQELEGDLLFPHDSATAHTEAAEVLDGLADHNRACVDRTVTVTGHTDSQGSHDYNDSLSLERAEFVAARLREHGFQDVVAVGSGKRDLACTGDYDGNDDVNDPCPAANRRVVVEFSDEEV